VFASLLLFFFSLFLSALALFALIAEADNLDDFFLVEVLEASACDHIIVVLFREQ